MKSKIALAQTNACEKVGSNAQKAEKLIREAAEKEIVCSNTKGDIISVHLTYMVGIHPILIICLQIIFLVLTIVGKLWEELI